MNNFFFTLCRWGTWGLWTHSRHYHCYCS